MSKAKARTSGKRSPKKKAGVKATKGTVDLTSVRQQIASLVGTEAMGMVETTIGEVDKGHYAAMKYLFEMVGLYPAAAPEEAAGENSLAKTLLRRLGLPEPATVETEVTKLAGAEQIPQPSET